MKTLYTLLLVVMTMCLTAQTEMRTEPFVQSGWNMSNTFDQGIYVRAGVRNTFMQGESAGFYVKGSLGIESTYSSDPGVARYYSFQVGAGLTDGKLLYLGVLTGFNRTRNVERPSVNDTGGFGYMGLDFNVRLIDVTVNGRTREKEDPKRTVTLEVGVNALVTSNRQFLGRIGLTAKIDL